MSFDDYLDQYQTLVEAIHRRATGTTVLELYGRNSPEVDLLFEAIDEMAKMYPQLHTQLVHEIELGGQYA